MLKADLQVAETVILKRARQIVRLCIGAEVGRDVAMFHNLFAVNIAGDVHANLLAGTEREGIDDKIRIHIQADIALVIVQLVVVAALVTIVSQLLKAFVYDVSVQLSVYVGLIITNCILMGRLEAFAMQNGPWASTLDGIGNGLGYAWVLVAVGFVRELFGSGKLFDYQVIPDSWYVANGGWYMNNGMMVMPAMSLIIVGCVIWAHRSINKEEK